MSRSNSAATVKGCIPLLVLAAMDLPEDAQVARAATDEVNATLSADLQHRFVEAGDPAYEHPVDRIKVAQVVVALIGTRLDVAAPNGVASARPIPAAFERWTLSPISLHMIVLVSRMPVDPAAIDQAAFASLREFQAKMKQTPGQGFSVVEYRSYDELRAIVRAELTRKLAARYSETHGRGGNVISPPNAIVRHLSSQLLASARQTKRATTHLQRMLDCTVFLGNAFKAASQEIDALGADEAQGIQDRLSDDLHAFADWFGAAQLGMFLEMHDATEGHLRALLTMDAIGVPWDTSLETFWSSIDDLRKSIPEASAGGRSLIDAMNGNSTLHLRVQSGYVRVRSILKRASTDYDEFIGQADRIIEALNRLRSRSAQGEEVVKEEAPRQISAQTIIQSIGVGAQLAKALPAALSTGSTEVTDASEVSFHKFLADKFKPDEFRREVLSILPDCNTITQELTASQTTVPAQWFFDLVEALRQRGGLDKPFFEAVIRARPRFRREIEAWEGKVKH